MGYDHTMHLTANIAEGVTVEQVTDALMPIVEYAGYNRDRLFDGGTLGYNEFEFNQENRELWVSTHGEVGYGYHDLVGEVASNLNKIVAEPGEIWLYDHDTGDIDEAKTIIEFGPSDEAINAYIAKRDIKAGLDLMKSHLDDTTFAVAKDVLNVWYLRNFRSTLD
jgi:hypothetical protein